MTWKNEQLQREALVRCGYDLLNIIIDFNPKDLYDCSFQILVFRGVFRADAVHILNLIQDGLINNAAAVFQMLSLNNIIRTRF